MSLDATPSEIYDQGNRYEQVIAQCRKEGILFEDPLFPATDEALFYSKKPPRPFPWKRPREITPDAQLFVDGASRFDIEQGMLGDCWLLAAVAGLSLDPHLLHKVIPPDQNFDNGIVKFNFWQYGKWVTVIVDDRLPTYNNKLVFLRSKETNEFWSALLEKAYAKLHGGYECLKGGSTIEAMEDFTGGVSESFDLTKDPPSDLFQILLTSYDRDSQIGCSIAAKPNEIEAKNANGLIKGHAYTVTDVRKVEYGGSTTLLIRIRNPWGRTEWTGPWSDGSREWDRIPDNERKRLGLVSQDDGEFWMEFCDFKRNFNRIDMCHLDPDTMTGKGKKKWEAHLSLGSWQRHATAGGCRNFPDTFWINPQFMLTLEEEDDQDDDGSANKPGATCLVSVMQKNRRALRKAAYANLTIGFAIYKANEDFEPPEGLTREREDTIELTKGLPKDFFLYNESTARSPSFVNAREVCGRFKLPVGNYVVVPSTFEPNQEGDFLIRIYTMKMSKGGCIDEQSGMVDVPRQPPPEQDDAQIARFRGFFDKVSGCDMEVDAWELQEILNAAFRKEIQGGGFSVESCKSMVALSDKDRSGKLVFKEFLELWMTIVAWKAFYKKYDADNSGAFDGYEMKGALNSLGFRLSNSAFSALILRYADKKGKVTFDGFIAAAIKLKFMFTTYSDQADRGAFKFDDFLTMNIRF